jgi:MFS transporter, NRE family, putaive nickel resistance protein
MAGSTAVERAVPDRLVANRDYLRLFTAQLTSLIGSGMTSVALAAFAYELTGRDATVVIGTALMLRILAFVLLAPIAGVVADRVNRKRMLVTADLVRMGLLALFPFITTEQQIYALIFAVNAATAFFSPTFEATLPDVVGRRLYTRAISLSRVAHAVQGAVGPMLAGLFIALVGVRWTFWADGVTYLISALLVMVSAIPATPSPAEPFPWRRFGPQLTHGSRVLLREPALRRALLLYAGEAVVGAAIIVNTVVYVHEVLGQGNTAFAITMAAVGAGSAFVALRLPRSSEAAREGGGDARDGHLRYHAWANRTMMTGGVLVTVALLPGVLAPGLLLLAVLWAVKGAGQVMVSIPSVGLLAEHTASEERGRAYSAHFALTHLVWLGAYPAVGYLAREIGTPATFTLAALSCGLLVGLAWWAGRGDHREHAIQTE